MRQDIETEIEPQLKKRRLTSLENRRSPHEIEREAEVRKENEREKNQLRIEEQKTREKEGEHGRVLRGMLPKKFPKRTGPKARPTEVKPEPPSAVPSKVQETPKYVFI
jgi:hypothetical protein